MNDGIRFRHHLTEKSPIEPFFKSRVILKPKSDSHIKIQHLLFSLTIILLISLTVIILEKILPEPQLIKTEKSYPDKFVAERAKAFIYNLTSFGPRVAGSYENEVLTINFLTNVILNIIDNANLHHRIEFDITRHSGSFSLKFLDGMTHIYKNVQNIVVKIGSSNIFQSSHSLLLNCHFDSFVESPGASDDAAGCAVMLEILRVISQSSIYLKHNIIFLFNGAEENILQASHGFITQHKWAKEVKTFINLEACGAGGRELLFQAGPHSAWILELYSRSVPYPYASTLAQEIFESGIVPGETDFRIFRDFGQISGLDFAWSKNGYVYHTKFDSINQIPSGSLQRTGDNILALTLGIINSNYLANETFSKVEDSLIFFDFLGIFVIHWSEFISRFVNIVGVVIGLYSIYLNIKLSKKDIKKSTYVKQLIICIAIVICSWIMSMGTVTAIALLLTKLDKVMSWYTRPAWLFFLYICPTISISMTFFLFIGNHQKKIPIVVLVKNAERVINVFIGVFLISTGILILTPLGFPYSGDPSSPTPERFMIIHTQRQYYHRSGALRYSGTGYWLVNLDMNSPHSISAFVPEVAASVSTIEDCKNELYCGLPYLLPVTTFLWKTNWIPGPPPFIPILASLTLIRKSRTGKILSFSFNITGPDHIGIMLSPHKNIHLEQWSILDETPLQGPFWNERETYFVYYSCVKDCKSLYFSIDLMLPADVLEGPSISIALGGHFLHGEYQQSLRFKNFLSKFPAWTVTTAWTASYTSWEF